MFSTGQWGMDAIAKEGRMPAGFVSTYWADADNSTRVEFCRFAEMQLMEYADEGLRRFLVESGFGDGTAGSGAGGEPVFIYLGNLLRSQMHVVIPMEGKVWHSSDTVEF